MKLDG